MNAFVNWIEVTFSAIPLPLLEVWGRFAYFLGFAVMIVAFGGFTLRPGGRWGLGREQQAWDRKAFLSIPLTFILIVGAGYLGSFIVLVPGAQTFESLKDLAVFLCVVLFGYPALITVPFAYGLSDLIEGTPPEFIVDWLPGYFINPACFWLAYQFFGKNPDFRRAQTWFAYAGFVLIFMGIEPVLWGYICSGKFTPEISFHTISPALFFTTGVTWLLAPFAMLGALPLARKLGLFWAEINGHVKERSLWRREWLWVSGPAGMSPATGIVESNVPIRMLILVPFMVLMLLMVGATAYVTLRSAEGEANRLATRLHQEITRNITLYLDDQLTRTGQATPEATADLLRHLPVAKDGGRAFIIDGTGRVIASSAGATDPVTMKAIATLRKNSADFGHFHEEQEFRFIHITAKPLSRETWLARAAIYPNQVIGHGRWIVISTLPESYYLAGVRTGNSRSAMVFVLALFLSLGVAAMLASMVTAPLRRLAKATRALAQGDLAQQLPDSNLEELNVVTRSFNDMAGRLKQNFDSVRGEVEMRKGAELQVRRLNRTYAMLSEVNRLLVRKYEQREILARACQIAVERGGFRLAWIGLLHPATGKLRIVAQGSASPDTLEALQQTLDDPALGCDFTAQALRTGSPAVCDDIEHDPRSTAWRPLAMARGYRSLVALPLIEGGKPAGTFNLYAGERGFFDQSELQLLNELAANIAFAREMAQRETERLASEARNSRQRDALINQTGSQGLDDDDLPTALRRITESSARTLIVARVSVWRYSPNHDAIECRNLFELGAQRHSSGSRLTAADYPTYFRALEHGEVLAIDDACADPRTQELCRDYFMPLQIGALMDIPIYMGGTVVGVLCHEHLGNARTWTADEKTFALAMANLVSLSIEGWERRQAESALRTSEERFRELAETIDEVFWINDPAKNQILYVSPAYERIWGRSCQSLYDSYRSWLDAIHPDDRERMLNAAMIQRQLAGTYDEEFRIVRPDGSSRWIRARAFPVRDSAGNPARIVGVARDITERRTLEEQLHQAQKMEAIGQLAGGVAHDFNNILAAILMQTELLLRHDAVSDKVKRGLDMIRLCSERATNLTRQLLLFSRKQVMQPRVIDLNESVTRLSRMLNRIIGADIKLQLKLSPDPLMTHADDGMIDQVLMNLVVNSRDAMPQGGSLIIETATKTIDEQIARIHPDAKPGRYVWLCVSDTGTGIKPEVLARIFEPFFTTKRPGKGTGLGLATVFGIVKQHQGWIRVYSEPGRGASFQVFLPASNASAVEVDPIQPQTGSLRGTETILLAEDDPSVRQMTHDILTLYGYHVIETCDGIKALEAWHRHRETISLLLTDIVMPGGLGGKELAAQLLADNPKLKIIYTSGYSAEMAGTQLELRDGENYLQKPCATDQMLRCVRATLDA